jgi:hypothetical protein
MGVCYVTGMSRTAPDPDLVAACLEQVRAGTPLREIGKAAGVTATTIKRWADKHGTARGAPPPAELPAALAGAAGLPEVALTDVSDNLATLKRMLADTLRNAEQFKIIGNATAASRAMRDAGTFTGLIHREEHLKRDDRDTLRISRQEIAEAIARVTERLATIAARPLLCAHCSRALSVQWGKGGQGE